MKMEHIDEVLAKKDEQGTHWNIVTVRK